MADNLIASKWKRDFEIVLSMRSTFDALFLHIDMYGYIWREEGTCVPGIMKVI